MCTQAKPAVRGVGVSCCPSAPPLLAPGAGSLDDGFELPRVAERVLDDHLAHRLVGGGGAGAAVLLRAGLGLAGGGHGGEEDLAVPNDPAAVVGELDDCALRVEEKQRLGRAQRQRRVGALAARGDLGADLRRQDLSGRGGRR